MFVPRLGVGATTLLFLCGPIFFCRLRCMQRCGILSKGRLRLCDCDIALFDQQRQSLFVIFILYLFVSILLASSSSPLLHQFHPPFLSKIHHHDEPPSKLTFSSCLRQSTKAGSTKTRVKHHSCGTEYLLHGGQLRSQSTTTSKAAKKECIC